MRIRVDDATFEKDTLTYLRSGAEGEIYNLPNGDVVKLYFNEPHQSQVLKLNRLFDIGREFSMCEAAKYAAFPLSPATRESDHRVVGFRMRCVQGGFPLSRVTYSARDATYKSTDTIAFTDDSAIHAVYSMFSALAAMSARRVVVGDVSLSNLLVDPQDGSPVFIDLDSSKMEDMPSSSAGTEGYVDPRLLEMDRNAEGGLRFDHDSDVFSLTVVAFYFLFGLMPYMVPTHPPLPSTDAYIKRGISLLHVADGGDEFLEHHGLRSAQPARTEYVRARMAELAKVPGTTGHDGGAVVRHFRAVFVDGHRECLSRAVQQAPTTRAGSAKDIRRHALPAVRMASDPEFLVDYAMTRGIRLESSIS